jgi:hypothetical protein
VIAEGRDPYKLPGKFLLTPIMHDKTEAPVIDATEAYARFLRGLP